MKKKNADDGWAQVSATNGQMYSAEEISDSDYEQQVTNNKQSNARKNTALRNSSYQNGDSDFKLNTSINIDSKLWDDSDEIDSDDIEDCLADLEDENNKEANNCNDEVSVNDSDLASLLDENQTISI